MILFKAGYTVDLEIKFYTAVTNDYLMISKSPAKMELQVVNEPDPYPSPVT